MTEFQNSVKDKLRGKRRKLDRKLEKVATTSCGEEECTGLCRVGRYKDLVISAYELAVTAKTLLPKTEVKKVVEWYTAYELEARERAQDVLQEAIRSPHMQQALQELGGAVKDALMVHKECSRPGAGEA